MTLAGSKVQTACDRCTQGVMDADNPHLRGLCRCPCHEPPAGTDTAPAGCLECERLRAEAEKVGPVLALLAPRIGADDVAPADTLSRLLSERDEAIARAKAAEARLAEALPFVEQARILVRDAGLATTGFDPVEHTTLGRALMMAEHHLRGDRDTKPERSAS